MGRSGIMQTSHVIMSSRNAMQRVRGLPLQMKCKASQSLDASLHGALLASASAKRHSRQVACPAVNKGLAPGSTNGSSSGSLGGDNIMNVGDLKTYWEDKVSEQLSASFGVYVKH